MEKPKKSTDLEKSTQKISIGICAMAKKTQSRSMLSIITRFESLRNFKVIVFEENMILNEPVENWPYCQAFLSWFSKGFPLEKAGEYVLKQKPTFVINDIDTQYINQDRVAVYEKLQEFDIPMRDWKFGVVFCCEFLESSCKIHAKLLQNSRKINAKFTQNSCKTHAKLMQNSYKMHAKLMQN